MDIRGIGQRGVEVVRGLKPREKMLIAIAIFLGMTHGIISLLSRDEYSDIPNPEKGRSLNLKQMEAEITEKENSKKEEEVLDMTPLSRDVFRANEGRSGAGLELVGVMIGEKKLAIFADGTILTEGDKVKGNTIDKIGRNQVILVDNEGREKTLEVRRK